MGENLTRYCVDIDGTICSLVPTKKNGDWDYPDAKPFKDKIAKLNKLYDEGHTIIYFTARGMDSGRDLTELTKKQLKEWGVKYHKLIFGKPAADVYIDDKSINDVGLI